MPEGTAAAETSVRRIDFRGLAANEERLKIIHSDVVFLRPVHAADRLRE